MKEKNNVWNDVITHLQAILLITNVDLDLFFL